VKHKFQLFHRIDPDVDAARDFVATDLAKTSQLAREQFVRCVTPVFNAQTATGQAYDSDGRMLFLELQRGVSVMGGEVQVTSKMQQSGGNSAVKAVTVGWQPFQTRATAQPSDIPPFSEKAIPSTPIHVPAAAVEGSVD
jgi:LssY C-terminus